MLGRIAAASLGIASIYTVHGWGWRGLGPLARFLVYTIELLLKFTPKSSYIFVSKSVEREARQHLWINETNGVTIYNGLPNHPPSLEPQSNPVKILMPARVANAKDHETLVKAFELLALDAELVLCGGDTDTAEFRTLIAQWAPSKKHRIALLGQRLDVIELLNQTNIFALISNFEALPISIIEAMRSKRAIVATDVGGISELVQDKISGLLVRPNDVTGVSNALTTLANPDIREKMSHAARQSFDELFRSNEMASAVLKTYASAAGRTRRQSRS
jgi:glycosyltransferase involved in cell wall biosynthesis